MPVNPKVEASMLMADILKRMHSFMAYIACVHDNQQDVIMVAWSAGAMATCDMAQKPIDYHISKMGLWGEALRQKKVIVTNDYLNLKSPAKRGYPKGHVEIKRHINGPIMYNGKVIAIVGVGNSFMEYTAQDENTLRTFLAENTNKMLLIRDAAFAK